MSKEIDIAALRKAAQELIAYADKRVPGWEADYKADGRPRFAVALPIPALEVVALLDRLEQTERDARSLKRQRDQAQSAMAAHRIAMEQAEKERDELKRATTIPMEEKGSQNWTGMSGAVAHHLIERHAENWADVDMMMAEWADARCAGMRGEGA